ncbi:serine/threonine-protein phosphatase [Streptomyces sp. So13.3]|uniref:PP2C family protein-serine/threonine phosphatase n=1 Tax=Streptomyces TaxID=1883 RepID=UPI001106700F|nr:MULTISPECIES: PP2C family protein-serine/threonine phosphatase [Streptomyces]MCZ4098784.1 PP2C family protein-serine/threonine phosphatase [Streptomyces sp. H39-C1]QNA71492.1 serine/threonine-protein phosphatase [Streptomyces sp. So13.3]
MNALQDSERALRDATPPALLDALRPVLARCHDALDAELLMADYGLGHLQAMTVPPHGVPPLPVDGSGAGRAFGSQEPYAERRDGRSVLHLPVTARGDRLGVLSVMFAQPPDPAATAELLEIAGLLAREVVVAERDTDLYVQARRLDRLTLAAEMQWQLLPARSCTRPEFALGAQLEPAYDTFGDNFDWSASPDALTLSITNGMGDGINAALLTSLGVGALRNARRAGLPLADQAALADQAVYGQHRGTWHLACLLLRFELATGLVEIIDAGSPRAFVLRDGTVRPLTFDAQLPLGMFDGTHYEPESIQALPGDRLLFVSDGVHAVTNAGGEAYGDRALARALLATRLLPAADVPRAVLRELTTHRGSSQGDDDALVVCLDWFGAPA